MHKLTIQNGRIFLDGMELKDVTEYELKSSADALGTTELNLKLCVATSDVSINELAKGVNGE